MNRLLGSLMVVALVAAGTTTGGAQTRAAAFQAGDRILLRVEGDSALSDTFTVVAGPALRLPIFGEISLAGVSRSDLEAHLTRELGRYIKNPVVQARALIRVSVLGEVTRPGFYAVPVDLVLPDALMLADRLTMGAPDVAVDPSGNVIVVWESRHPLNISLQRFDASGTALGPVALANVHAVGAVLSNVGVPTKVKSLAIVRVLSTSSVAPEATLTAPRPKGPLKMPPPPEDGVLLAPMRMPPAFRLTPPPKVLCPLS